MKNEEDEGDEKLMFEEREQMSVLSLEKQY